MFVGVIFSVKYTFFGHIHSVMLIRSNDYSSQWWSLLVFSYFSVEGKYTLDSQNNFDEFLKAMGKQVFMVIILLKLWVLELDIDFNFLFHRKKVNNQLGKGSMNSAFTTLANLLWLSYIG